jgi:hypothetical protein
MFKKPVTTGVELLFKSRRGLDDTIANSWHIFEGILARIIILFK